MFRHWHSLSEIFTIEIYSSYIMLLFLKLCYLSQRFPCLLITLRKFIYRYVSGIRLSWKNLLPILTIFEYFIKKLIRTTLFHFKCEFFKSFRAWLLQYVNLKVVTAVWLDHFQEFDEIWYSYSANPQSHHLSISIKKQLSDVSSNAQVKHTCDVIWKSLLACTVYGAVYSQPLHLCDNKRK